MSDILVFVIAELLVIILVSLAAGEWDIHFFGKKRFVVTEDEIKINFIVRSAVELVCFIGGIVFGILISVKYGWLLCSI